MTKSNNGPFTHHERLRYSYLLKNLAHLNGQQASEFNYLQGKLDAYEAERRYQAQREDYQAAWRQPYDNRYDYYQERDYEAANQLTEEGLPIYREEVAQSKPKRKKVQRQAAPSINVGSKVQVASSPEEAAKEKEKAQEGCQASA